MAMVVMMLTLLVMAIMRMAINMTPKLLFVFILTLIVASSST